MTDHEQVAQKIVRAHFLLSDGTGIGATLEAAFATALRAAVAEENEACAKECEAQMTEDYPRGYLMPRTRNKHASVQDAAAAIRARKGGGK